MKSEAFPSIARKAGAVKNLVRAAAFALCFSASWATPQHAFADVLRIGVSQPIDSLNPFVASSDYSSIAYQYGYPFLTIYDADLKIVPYFATDWSSSDDGTVWTFHTRKDAKWSDGNPLTAKDAAFTYDMILKYKDSTTGKFAGWISHLKSAEATDDNTVVLTYDGPAGDVPVKMQSVPILPAHIWSEVAGEDGSEIDSFENAAPWVSGGPFILSGYKKNQLALFKANPNWWGETKPRIEGFGLQFFANSDAMVSALTSGQLDMVGQTISPTAIDALKAAGMVIESAPSTGFHNMIINTNPEKKAHHELLNPKVREALELAIDRDAIIKQVWLGYATPGTSIVAPATGWHDPDLASVGYDIKKANTILDEAGYARGADGIRVADGIRMEYDVIFPTEVAGAGDRTFKIIQAGYEQIGIRLAQRKMDADAANHAIMGENRDYRDYDIAMWLWVPPLDPDFILSVLTCAQRGNNNDSGYCNPEYDKLYMQQAQISDRTKRAEVVNQMQELAYRERPYIALVYPQTLEAHSPNWTGFVSSPLVGSVNNLSIETLLNAHKK
ncbi:ABC transporter substrate-binding protein [Brucella rhizosphaerae]|uniref:Bacterial extracellular solute-binding, 5 Middle family protein n=1 Tax=Brucella rhizosphaerae TaxID=571254 RepID=A0A256FPB3_9HYPH|nr:ABC transporter substrate-binding protein [Brucella rhizosphaerae]OYR16679.1 bacterial extracellular solute-binding, 5 Middle family protein [Brucella rhizosphaerae]